MKALTLAALLSCCFTPTLAAQIFNSTGPSPFARDYKVDFAIPDAPAFKLIETDQSAILRPGTPNEVTAMLSQFYGEDGDFRIPAGFALEISPALLIGGPQLLRATYQQRRLLYATRLSAATAQATDTTGRLIAVGLRLGLVDESDLRLDDQFAHDTSLQVTPITTRINDIRVAAGDRRARPTDPIVLNDAEKQEIAELAEVIKDRWAARYWNARAIDVGLGFKAETLDDGGADPRITDIGLWATYGFGFGRWGQLLTGVRLGGSRPRDANDFDQSLGLGVRMYAGTNDYKAFVELQNLLIESQTADLTFNSGAEVKIGDWIWANGAIGYVPNGGEGGRVKTSLKLKTALPRI